MLAGNNHYVLKESQKRLLSFPSYITWVYNHGPLYIQLEIAVYSDYSNSNPMLFSGLDVLWHLRKVEGKVQTRTASSSQVYQT